jgi:myo-inositol 2-dehydrogenase/D-chiro-inositol 1-dehydrogenase
VREAEVDGWIVASDDESHFAIVSDCLDRDVPVLCEKPMTLTRADARRLVEREAEAGRRLISVGFMRRFDPDYSRLRSLLRDGAPGTPMLVVGTHRMPTSAAPFGADMLVASSATHDIDTFRWLTGEEVAEVTCESRAAADAGATTVLLTMRSESGVLGMSELTATSASRYDVSCELIGSAGTAATAAPAASDWIDRFAAAYETQALAWLTALVTGSSASATARDGYANSAVVEAAGRALRTGERVDVDLAD